ncbi:hypothetical protein QM467_05770 [Rhodoblastus sp. 17X3]|uniref:hyaluronate lyase N-terminal domain-containing protein n=1 Tax=Rhodoblastus sp. 17X3 TaxID=3047026 RepID=UPI0024B76B96|nr:hypothetical protein [Rhodoblastus sp. 17X3]MDI9847568.1 hypothetical protein [Rhodoblastus sp. 17X3]
MSVQVKRRRDTAANVAAYTGAQGELIVDATNNRVTVHDGVTPGGWAAAKLSDQFGLIGVGTAPDPSNPLSVYGASALFNGTSFNFTINKSASGNTAGVLFQDGFSGRAQIGLLGDDNFHFKVSANGSTWTEAIKLDAATGAATFANARTAVSDAAYTVLTTDRIVAYSALTAARVVSLPAASSFPAGHPLIVIDESGNCSATKTLTLSPNGSDTMNGLASAVLSSPSARIILESNGSSRWAIISRSANVRLFAASTTYVPTPGLTKANVYLVSGGGGGGGGALQAASAACSGGAAGGAGSIMSGAFTAEQIGASQTVAIGAGGTAGAAASTSSSAGGTGGAGGSSSFGLLLSVNGGLPGQGGQLAANSSGGGSGSPPVGGGVGGGAGAAGGNASGPGIGSGGGGDASGAAGSSGGIAVYGPSGGGAGGGISVANAVFSGGSGGISFTTITGAGGGSAGVAGTAGSSAATLVRPLSTYAGMGGGGGGSSLTAAGAGGAGGLGGGGGGGSAQNGGTAGAGGVGGAGYAIILEDF